jgi:tRNA modification GTPase
MHTIVAVATPPGRSAIGVVRLSGPHSLDLLRQITHDSQFTPSPNQVVLKTIYSATSAEVLDQALITYFKGPHSFTGEDMAEISCHGSPVILRQLLDELQRLDARLAGPGEFTLRACQNGKMNLSQAEAIRDLINAQTKAAAHQATRQLKGELSSALQKCEEQLVKVIVRLESALEFVEDDLPMVQQKEMLDQVGAVRAAINKLADTYSAGRLLKHGIKVALVGRPNVGKSSLFNRLLNLDRAIVTELPGTTRDSLTESISLNGIPVVLTDTAGMHEAEDMIEEIGVARTYRAMADADLLIVVLDGSTTLQAEDVAVVHQASEAHHVIAINKSDLPQIDGIMERAGNDSVAVRVSAQTGQGLEELTAAILAPFGAVDSETVGLLVTDSRHHGLLVRAGDSIEEAEQLLEENASEELVLVGLHNALKFLGEITGETTTDDILGEIFSTFCIGK